MREADLETAPPSPVGRLVRNVGALVASQAVTKVINIAVSLLLVRWLGPSELGRYAYVIAFCYPFGALTDFGLGTLAIREISRDRDPGRETVIVAAVSRLLVLFSSGAVVLMLVVAAVTKHDGRILLGILVAGLSSPLAALTTPSLVVLTAREELHLVSLFHVLRSFLGSLATCGILLAGGTTLSLLMGDVAVNGVMLLAARRLEGPRSVPPRLAPPLYLTLARKALPFGLVLVGFTLYYRVDMVMLGWLRDSGEVGRYAAVYRFVDALLLLAAALSSPLYPRLSSLIGRDPARVRILLETSWRLMAALAIPLAVGATVVASPLTLALFGSDFRGTAGLLCILIWAGPPILLLAVPGHAMNALDRVWYLAGVYGVSTLTCVSANLVLIPRYGALGASLTTVACAWLVLALVLRDIRRALGVLLPWSGLWRYACAALGMAAVLALTQTESLVVRIVIGAAAYASGLWLLGYHRSGDIEAVRALLRQ